MPDWVELKLYRCPVHGWVPEAAVNLGVALQTYCAIDVGEDSCGSKTEGECTVHVPA